jgi:nucleoside-diphosphate-sugar epimerase
MPAKSVKAVITGGGGYFGRRLGAALMADGGYSSVVLFDLYPPAEGTPPGCQFFQGDVQDIVALEACFTGASVVFHSASYGMSGRAQLQRSLVKAVNVGGTHAVIAACKAAGVPRLVYTSTYNVVFGGEPIVNGNEDSHDYFPIDRHPDAYSPSKALAEQAVLGANMDRLAGGRRYLRTCALRSAGRLLLVCVNGMTHRYF